MLIDTGYEGKFDFPARQGPPEITYLLASVPRAGSTYFSHEMWSTGCLGAPLEYLNYEPLGPYGFAARSADTQLDLWRSVLKRRCSPNGVFGLKAFPVQLQSLEESNPVLLQEVLAVLLAKDRPRHVVYLRRRDIVAQAVSYARANMTGVWRKEQESAAPREMEYSQDQIEAAERGIRLQQSVWERMFIDLRIDPLELWHEDVLDNPAQATTQVAQYLGLPIEASSKVAIPEIRKQSPGNTQAWIDRYARSRPVE